MRERRVDALLCCGSVDVILRRRRAGCLSRVRGGRIVVHVGRACLGVGLKRIGPCRFVRDRVVEVVRVVCG